MLKIIRVPIAPNPQGSLLDIVLDLQEGPNWLFSSDSLLLNLILNVQNVQLCLIILTSCVVSETELLSIMVVQQILKQKTSLSLLRFFAE